MAGPDQGVCLLKHVEGRLVEERLEETEGLYNTNSVQGNGLLNMWQISLCIVGASAGYGILVIQLLLVSIGWLGFVVFVVQYAATVYTAVLLGRCWNMVRAKWGSEQHPYGAIGFEAFGSWSRGLTNFLIAVSSLITGLGMITVSANVTLLLGGPALHGTFCYWPLVYCVALCPLLWLRTPKDFWNFFAFSGMAVLLAYVLIALYVSVGGLTGTPYASSVTQGVSPETDIYHLVVMSSVVFIVVGFHYLLPTLHQDMQQPQVYTKAVTTGYALSFLSNLPGLFVIYLVYGGTLTNVTGDANVLILLPDGPLKTVATLLILLHIFACFVFMNNPVFQFLEEVFEIPVEFTWKRAALRSTIVMIQLVITETLPHFTLIAGLFHGVVSPPLVFMLPCLYYLRLRKTHQEPNDKDKGKAYVLETVVCWVLIAATPFTMAGILYITVSQLAQGRTVFKVPCYINATLAHS